MNRKKSFDNNKFLFAHAQQIKLFTKILQFIKCEIHMAHGG